MKGLFDIYSSLMNEYGPQGWWPLTACRRMFNNSGYVEMRQGYHPGDYTYPKNDEQRFEICVGAVLTQNTSWINVERALGNLAYAGMLSAEAIMSADIEEIKKNIRPAGYFNQKSVYLKEFAEFFIMLGNSIPSRKELLKVKGVGPETADSILLYAYNMPEFVVDAYTKRIFSGLGFFDAAAKYDTVKKVFEDNIPKDIIVYQEFHALIVMLGKNKTEPVLHA